jgi:dTDP-4-amino-4,6-dideoxygalactose transaminase
MLAVNDLARRTARYRPLIDDACRRVLDRGWYILGPEVRAFENAFAGYLSVGHCIGVASGTDAIRLALTAVGVKPGHTVATAANAGMYATTALRSVGATPHFLDVDATTYVITLESVHRAIGAGVDAVVATHLYGLAIPDIAAIAKACRVGGVPLVEDCAQAHGATIDGTHVGTFGDAGCFSFYPTKNLGALGDGGAVVTRDASVAESIGRLRQYGWTDKYTVTTELGANSRLDELQAAILSALLPHLDSDNARRREIAARYNAAITPDVVCPPQAGAGHVAHLYVIRSKHRNSLQRHLRERQIGSDVHYPIPDHRQPVFAGAFAATGLPVTEMLVDEILTLPCYPEMTDAEVECVIAAVNGWQS